MSNSTANKLSSNFATERSGPTRVKRTTPSTASLFISRTYKEGKEYPDPNSFSGADLLKLGRIAAKACDAIVELRAGERGCRTDALLKAGESAHGNLSVFFPNDFLDCGRHVSTPLMTRLLRQKGFYLFADFFRGFVFFSPQLLEPARNNSKSRIADTNKE